MKGIYRDCVLGVCCGALFTVHHCRACYASEKKTNLLSTSEWILKVVGVILFALLECKGL